MHLNSCNMIGRVSAKGPALRYSESGIPACSFVLEVDELTHGKVYTTYIPCEISGKYAEQSAEEVEAGDVIHISGKWKYKSSIDQKSGVKVSKPVVSSWGVSQRIPALTESPQGERTATGEGVDQEGEPVNVPGGDAERPLPKKRTRGPGYPGRKSALQN